MNQRTERLRKEYDPKLALIVYASDERWEDTYLESHEISAEGKLLEGKPLLQETLQGLIDVFFDERQNQVKMGGIIPHNLLAFDVLPGGHFKMVWYRPAEQRFLHFKETLKIPSGKAWVPPMMYVAIKNSLLVFAIDDDQRPDEKTKLRRAPFHNVSVSGDVCLGSAKVNKPEKRTYSLIMKYWEDMFWLSEFTHLTGTDSLVKGNINLLWARLIKNHKLKWETLDELIPSPININEII